MTDDELEVSVVIPLFSEDDNIEPPYLRLKQVLNRLDKEYEILIADDGRADASFEVLKRFHADDRSLKAVRLRRGFGQSAAFGAGFDRAGGQVIITMHADLQNDLADIPELLGRIVE